MKNPELLALATVPWQFFCTLTFSRERDCRRYGPQMFVALMRVQARCFRVHFTDILWCLRREVGGSTGRLHFHAVIAGLPPGADSRNCLALMSQWEKLGGGIARVSVYKGALSGIEYILKGDNLGALAGRLAGDYHELSKFGTSCDVTLSVSAVRWLENLQREGHRGGGHESRGTDTAGNTVQRAVGNVLPVVASLERR